jgi:hypothetical protein
VGSGLHFFSIDLNLIIFNDINNLKAIDFFLIGGYSSGGLATK